MLHDQTIFVVVPCYNEETQITRVVETMPDFVDRIVIVDDVSKDRTTSVVEALQQQHSRVTLLRHQKNGGVGKAIGTGYKFARDEGADVTVVMAGDAQMDPNDLESVVTPVIEGRVDYCKGNRFKYLGGLAKIPPVRKFGNFVLSALTKIATGYWHVTDSQTGYTAISIEGLRSVNLDAIYPRYGMPNDFLASLNIAEMRVGEVPVNPLYGVGEQSKLRPTKVALPILRLLFRIWRRRIFQSYVVQNGHPIVLVLMMAIIMSMFTLFCAAYVLVDWLILSDGFMIPKVPLIAGGVGFISAAQFTLTALQMDFEYNERLCVRLTPAPKRRSGDIDVPERQGSAPGSA